MTVSADIGLFMYLQEKVCERKTKTEAYCNLLKKSSENFVSPILKGRNQTLGSHQCHVTITDLSIEWHWHRSTVRAFLEKLEEYGQIEITRLPKSFIITMPVQGNHEDNNIGNNKSDFIQSCNRYCPNGYRTSVLHEKQVKDAYKHSKMTQPLLPNPWLALVRTMAKCL